MRVDQAERLFGAIMAAGVVLAVIAILCSCNPLDGVRDDCRKIGDDVRQECQAQADKAAALCAAEIEDVKTWLQTEAETRLQQAGCTKNDTGVWDCTRAAICGQRDGGL